MGQISMKISALPGSVLSENQQLKALLRAKAERTVGALWDTVGALLPAFTPSQCTSFFTAAGYEPD
jgi:hypothetical protein